MFKPYKYEKHIEYRSSRNLPRQIGVLTKKSPLAVILLAFGILIMFVKVLLPVVKIQADSEDQAPIISPISSSYSANLDSANGNKERFTFSELSGGFRENDDYVEIDGISQKKEDIEKAKREESKKTIPEYFYITIPKLDIENAKVLTNSTKLDPNDALGHYNGSCLPDEGCNSFIFGHSTFKGAKNKYKEGDYGAIFAKLDELEYGDEFYINYDGKEYRYLVALSKVQRPENVNPLESPFPKSLGKHEGTVELFTCTPSGTTKYRLSVIGKLVE